MKTKTILLSALILIFCNFALAAGDPPPLAMVKDVSTSVVNALQKNKPRLSDKKVIFNIVNGIAVPHFALNDIARAVVGPNYWDKATTATQAQFVKAFTRYVIDMYSSALSSYKDETLSFQPMRSFDANQNSAQVYSTIERSSSSPVSLNYRVIKKGSSWLIYDFSIEGISMIQSYRSQFGATLNHGGLEELTQKLQARK